MKTNISLATLVSATLLLSACANKPVPPDWQANAYAALKGFSSAYLSGNTRLADFEFARARLEIASTGRADLLARAELTRCATRVASLAFDNCADYQPLAPDAGPAEQAYAAYLTGHPTGTNPDLLPVQHRAIARKIALDMAQAGPAESSEGKSLLGAIEEPMARLIAAGVLLQSSRLTPADIEIATETASSQGWRRPLLAWLGVQLKRAGDAGNQAEAARIQRRINLVTAPATPQ